MRAFAKGQAVALRRWDFLSTDAATIDALSRDLGFLYAPLSSGFDHLIQTSIIDAGGRVYRQVYGMRIATPHFVEPLKELVFGTAPAASLFDQLSDKIRLFCTVYDPASDRYRFDYSLLVGLVTGLFVGVLFLYWVAKEWRRYRRGTF
jgi:protein SCO1/2